MRRCVVFRGGTTRGPRPPPQQPAYAQYPLPPQYPVQPVGVPSSGYDAIEPATVGPVRRLDPRELVMKPPRNRLVTIVPEGSVMVVERLGKFHRELRSGLNFLIPIVDRIRYKYSTKEQGILVPRQSAVTRDNVMVDIDGVLFFKIVDAEAASYNIDNPIFNVINLAQTTMRAEIGKMALDTLFEERAALNTGIVGVLRREASAWGVECMRCEIRDITVSDMVRQSMDLQAEAERRKRKEILDAEADAKAMETRAGGQRVAQQAAADAQAYTAQVLAEAQAKSIKIVGQAIAEHPPSISEAAISARVAEQYVDAFGQIAKETNSVVLPQNIGDGASFTAQALGMYRAIQTGGNSVPPPFPPVGQ